MNKPLSFSLVDRKPVARGQVQRKPTSTPFDQVTETESRKETQKVNQVITAVEANKLIGGDEPEQEPQPIWVIPLLPESENRREEWKKTKHLAHDLKKDWMKRPDQASLDAYERIPVQEFGRALIRGMGYVEGEGIGKSRKSIVQPLEVTPRPHRLGLGARPRPPELEDVRDPPKPKESRKKIP